MIDTHISYFCNIRCNRESIGQAIEFHEAFPARVSVIYEMCYDYVVD